MNRTLRIGTRDSQLAVWQATLVKDELAKHNIECELVYIKSEGDIDLVTPLYEIGVQGIFTRTLDAALLSGRVDIAVHSMKDVPTQMAKGIASAAVLKRASYKDLLVYKGEWSVVSSELRYVDGGWSMMNEGGQSAISSQQSAIRKQKTEDRRQKTEDRSSDSLSNVQHSAFSIDHLPFTTHHSPLTTHGFTIATSSIRRRAQWLHRYPNHTIENLRGNVNTRLKKVQEHNWNGAIFAAAGLERIHLRPEKSIELDWMLPAPAQGAIMVVCREEDEEAKEYCSLLHDINTAICAKAERDFLRTLQGGCSTPISALAEIKEGVIYFKGNIFSVDGTEHLDVEMNCPVSYDAGKIHDIGIKAGQQVLENGGAKIVESIRNATR